MSFSAEQLWNIGNLLLASHSLKDHNMKRGLLSAYFFRCAHDFAFLSEEEVGENLTMGYLACEGFRHGTNDMNYLEISLSSNSKTKSCDLCSQFSYQALFLSTFCVVETLNEQLNMKSNPAVDINSIENLNDIRISIQCLNAALSERHTLEMEGLSPMTKVHFDAVPWIFLNLLILQKDDQVCSLALEKGGLLQQFRDNFCDMSPSDGIMVLHQSDSHVHEIITLFQRVFQFATHAEAYHMSSSSKLLYSFCIDMLNDRDEMTTASSVNMTLWHPSLGTLYRKLLGMSHSVNEILHVFEKIGKRMKCSCADPSMLDEESDRAQRTNSNNSFSVQDLDFFVVDAHNRAVTLLSVGDAKSAEKLMVVCMNLLPHCSNEVECYGSDIRRTYRHAIAKLGAVGY